MPAEYPPSQRQTLGHWAWVAITDLKPPFLVPVGLHMHSYSMGTGSMESNMLVGPGPEQESLSGFSL